MPKDTDNSMITDWNNYCLQSEKEGRPKTESNRSRMLTIYTRLKCRACEAQHD
jgi:hypothetical protein